MSLWAKAESLADQMIAWRRDFHRHPELSFQEHRTARIVAETLESFGLEVQRGVGRTGVVGYLGEGTPVIGIRADMDALPILEENAVEYASQNPGVMHACGHDAHTAMALGVARILAEMPDRPPGQIRFLFQPSEEATDAENKSGAVRMIEDGALAGVDKVISLHVGSTEPAGHVRFVDGYMTAAEDNFHAAILGTGGHGAYPHHGTDPTYMLALVLTAIHGIRARRMDPIRAGVISIGSIHGGNVFNVIPSAIEISGTIRTYDEATRTLAKTELEQALSLTRTLGGDYRLEMIAGYPATYNDPAVNAVMRKAAADLLPADHFMPADAGLGAEDFSYMTQQAPGAMFFLGAAKDEIERPHHTPVFDIDEGVLPVGAAILAETAVRLLRGA
ncbi:MAG: amidohydrolase [Litorilinea sp.]